MKINTIKIQNFKGISDLRHDFTHPVTVVTGPVGIGKTSFIEAVRYGLTGELPLTPIQSGKKQAVVEMVCSSPEGSIDIFRDVTPPNKKSVRIMGRKVTGSSSETFLEETTNVSGAILKLATASDVLAELKPDAFGNLFLNESMEKKTLSDLITILNDNTSKEKATLYTNLSLDPTDALPVIVLDELKKLFKKSELSMEVIQKAHEEASTKRKEINAKYKLETSRTKKFTEMEKPEYDTSALRRKYEEFLVVEKNAAAYSKSLKAYQTALEKKKEQDKKIAALEFEIALKKTTSKQNPTFDYINNIITDWHDRNLKSPDEIEAFLEQRKKQIRDTKDLKAKVTKANHEQREYNNLDFLYANIGMQKGDIDDK